VHRARSFGRHEGPLRAAVNALKFGGRQRLARPLGQLLASLVTNPNYAGAWDVGPPAHIVPVPLHPARRTLRGFDQAELLAEEVSSASAVPLRKGFLLRVRDTPPQITLAAAVRVQNVRGAFALRHPLPSKGQRVLLIDDVYTTGATLEECARVLHRGGAAEVCAITLTRRTLD
jgi:ComF family protein